MSAPPGPSDPQPLPPDATAPAPTLVDDGVLGHVARLARLGLAPEERAGLADDLQRVLACFQELSAVPTDGVLPLVHPTERGAPLRADVVVAGLGIAAATAGAPAVEEGSFVVPKVIG